MKRRIAVFTGTRAEYGLLYWLMKDIQASAQLTLQVIVSGMHLSPEFGETWRQIEADGFPVDAKVEMLLSSDTPVGVVKSMGLGTIGFADALDRPKPDTAVMAEMVRRTLDWVALRISNGSPAGPLADELSLTLERATCADSVAEQPAGEGPS